MSKGESSAAADVGGTLLSLKGNLESRFATKWWDASFPRVALLVGWEMVGRDSSYLVGRAM